MKLDRNPGFIPEARTPAYLALQSAGSTGLWTETLRIKMLTNREYRYRILSKSAQVK
jgi:hypothetical protein